MSVTGEYRRLFEDLGHFLEDSSSPRARTLAAALRQRADFEQLKNVSVAAERSLTLLDPPATQSLDFENTAEDERYRELREHFLAICHVVVGR